MPVRRLGELIDHDGEQFAPELVAAAERALVLEPDRDNIAVAVRRLAVAEDRDEEYNEGVNLLATVLVYLAQVRPNHYSLIHSEGLGELRRMMRNAA